MNEKLNENQQKSLLDEYGSQKESLFPKNSALKDENTASAGEIDALNHKNSASQDEGEVSTGEYALPYEKLMNKNDIVVFERNNYALVILYPTGNGFWNSTEHSAFFMQYVINELLDLRNEIRVDYDYFFKKSRFFSAYNDRQVAKIKRELPRLGFTVLRDDDYLFIFELKYKIPVEELKEWMDDEKLKKERIDAYFLPDTGKTELYTLIRSIGAEVMFAMDKLKFAPKEVVGGRMLDCVMDMYHEYDKLSKLGNAPNEEALKNTHKKNITNALADLSFLVSISHDNKLIEDKRMMRMGTILHSMRRITGSRANNK
jgi:hypothetical protein